jgi:hypothetical protein
VKTNSIAAWAGTLAVCLLPFTLAQAQQPVAAVYYVSPLGNDANPGTLAAPFRSIQHAANVTHPGDTVLIRSGTYYEDQIDITISGTPLRPITFKAYPGEQPVIDFGLPVTTSWQPVPGAERIYRVKPYYGPSSHHHWPQTTAKVILNGRILTPASNCSLAGIQDCLVKGTFWADKDQGSDYGYTYIHPQDGSDPNQVAAIFLNYNSIKGYVFDTGIQSFNSSDHSQVANNIILEGLTLQGGERGVWIADPDGTHPHRNFTVRDCEIRYTNQYAIEWTHWDTSLADRLHVHDNGLFNYPRGINNWPTNIVGYYSTNITIQNSRIHDNHGEGVGPYLGSTNWRILQNTVYDNYSVNIYDDTDGNCSGEGNILIDGNFVYATGKYSAVTDIRNRPVGIAVANEHADTGTGCANPSQSNVTITNNIVYNAGKNGIQVFNYRQGPFYLKDSLIANNTVGATYSNNSTPANAINVQVADNVRVANNIAYPDRILLSGYGTTKPGSSGKGIRADHNLAASPRMFSASAGDHPVTVSGTVYADPGFCGGPSPETRSYFAIRTGSPARRAAGNYDIGAIQGGGCNQ